MAAKNTGKTEINPINELGAILDGSSLETLADLLADPDADYTYGQLARFGAAFSSVGDTLTAVARDGMYNRLAGCTGASSREIDAGVLFQCRPPTETVRINTAKVKADFPMDEYPAYYTRSHTKGTVAITL